jgi:hypothetical protein
MRTQLSMVGDDWTVTMLRDESGWIVEDATQISRSGHVRSVATQPFGGRHFSTRGGAVAASAGWLRDQGLLPVRA